ncbi:1,4-alpha-glucan branching enzyme GlgB [bacterium HR08]|nr:1,4-alpha-glucan branching enzyme GlgB [bacterium HR08]
MSTASPVEIELIVRAEHADPFHVLGRHPVAREGISGFAIRAFLPDAQEAFVVDARCGHLHPMERVHPEGFYEVVFWGVTEAFPYRLRVVDSGGVRECLDPYSFPPVLTDFDLYLIGEGTHQRIFEKLGAHVREVEGVHGVHFAVWAPNARRVSVVGDFNAWDGRRHPMRVRGQSGIWELFIPELPEGVRYKFEIKSQHGDRLLLKSDPYGFFFERPPKTATIVFDLSRCRFSDREWMEERARRQALDAPMNIYEVHLGSWRRVPEDGHRPLTYREAAHQLAAYVKEMGYTHVELLPILEHPFDGSWGYQALGYYAPTSRYGSPEDFAYFVNYLHEHKIGVILDWVPAHFPKDAHGLAFFDGTQLYEHADPRRGEHPDWGTLIFNHGRHEVRNFLLGSALFWLDRYHADGLRVDAVASMLYLDYSRRPGEWVPNPYGGNENLEAIAFLQRFNEWVHGLYPGAVTIAEESTAWPMVSRPTYLGGLGFTFKWNMGWMNDTLRYMARDPIYRKYHHHELTFSLMYAFSENYILPLSHDEVVHGKRSLLEKMPGDRWQKFANLRLLYGYMFGHPGKKLLFMGGEFGQWREWDVGTSLDWHLLEEEPHRQLHRYVRDLNHFYLAEPALYECDFEPSGFEWIDCHDWEQSVIAFLRRARRAAPFLIFVCNFTPVPRLGYRLGVPEPGAYREIFNSDRPEYGGSGLGNPEPIGAEPIPWSGRPYSVLLTLPPLAVIVLKRG